MPINGFPIFWLCAGKEQFEELFAGDEAARRLYLIQDNGRLSLHMLLKLLQDFSPRRKNRISSGLSTALQSSLF